MLYEAWKSMTCHTDYIQLHLDINNHKAFVILWLQYIIQCSTYQETAQCLKIYLCWQGTGVRSLTCLDDLFQNTVNPPFFVLYVCLTLKINEHFNAS